MDRTNLLSKRGTIFLVVWNGGEICETADLVRKVKKPNKVVIMLDFQCIFNKVFLLPYRKEEYLRKGGEIIAKMKKI